MARHSLTATGLRLILSALLLVIAVTASVAIYVLNKSLASYATEVSHATADAGASQNNIQALQKVQRELSANKAIIERTNNIVADSQSYQYQDQIITDINDYASKAGIGITNIDFGASTAPTATPGKAGTVPPSTVTVIGVKSTSVSITIKNPVVYNNLLRFIHSIEQNLTKMQVSRIGLVKGTGSDITSEVLTIEVYIK